VCPWVSGREAKKIQEGDSFMLVLVGGEVFWIESEIDVEFNEE
jgi:hypothetical protein